MSTFTFTTETRYLLAKEYKRAGGGYAWGVYDNLTKKFVEGGFFSKGAAREAAIEWNLGERS